MTQVIEAVAGLTIEVTEKGNVVVKKGQKPLQYFYGEYGVRQAEDYINSLIRQGEI